MEQVMLDMIPTGAKAVCHVSQYDIGRTIRFNLRSGGAVYTLSGTETIKVYIKKPDGTTAERNIANTSSTYVDWVTGEGDCDQAGNCECELVITSGTTVIGSKNFTVKIEEDPYNDQGVVTETAGPAIIATFTTNVVDLLQEVKCSINPIQNGTPWIDSNEVNKVPYIKRAVAGTATRIGNHLYDKLVGGTVAWNQIRTNGNFTATTGWNSTNSTRSVLNNVMTLTASSTIGEIELYDASTNRMELVENRKYFTSYKVKSNVDITKMHHRGFIVKNNISGFAANTENTVEIIDKATANKMQDLYFYGEFNSGDTINIKEIVCFDLTAMFGSTIADYIYSLEQATAGAGVAWFKALFPNDYYAYNAGELMSVKATAHVMKNASNQVIGNYALDSNLVLRGIPKLVNNKLEYDGDTYEASGAVTRRFGLHNTSNSSVAKSSPYRNSNGLWVSGFDTQGSPVTIANYGVVSSKLPFANDKTYQTADMNCFVPPINNNYYAIVCLTDATSGLNASSTKEEVAEALQAYLRNLNADIIYPLATPTTEQASPFTNPQVCDENGTEEYTDSRAVAIPVGHETYQANICPITGFDELNIQQAGANLLGGETLADVIINRVPNATKNTVNKTVSYNASDIRNVVIFDKFKANTRYTVIIKSVTGVTNLAFKYSDGTVSTIRSGSDVSIDGRTVVGIVGEWQTGATVLGYDDFGIFEGVKTVDDFNAYSGKLIKLEFDDTVYLAEVSCLNGVWKLKLLGTEVDLGDLTWLYNSTLKSFYARFDDGKASGNAVGLPALCDIYPVDDTNQYNNLPDGSISVGSNYISGTVCAIVVHDERYSSDGAFKTAMAGYKVICELATPTEITLDETEQFETLLGVNNVWHDGNGNTEVKYLYNA